MNDAKMLMRFDRLDKKDREARLMFVDLQLRQRALENILADPPGWKLPFGLRLTKAVSKEMVDEEFKKQKAQFLTDFKTDLVERKNGNTKKTNQKIPA